jgi:hypothetical protein
LHERSNQRLSVVALVPRLGAVHRLSQLSLVSGINRFCALHWRRGVCGVRALDRVFLVGCQRDVGTLVGVGDGLAIKKIDWGFWCEPLTGGVAAMFPNGDLLLMR